MSLTVSAYNQSAQIVPLPEFVLPPTARPAPGVNCGPIVAQPYPPQESILFNRPLPNPFMNSLQSVLGMMQQVMASVERVVSMVTNLVSGLFSGVQAPAAGQIPGAPSIGITGASPAAAPDATSAPAEQKPSKWENILNIGSTILSVVGMFTGGGAGSILGSLGGLFKGGAGKVVDMVKKGISLFT